MGRGPRGLVVLMFGQGWSSRHRREVGSIPSHSGRDGGGKGRSGETRPSHLSPCRDKQSFTSGSNLMVC